MRPRERRQSGEQDLFRSRLDQIIDMKHALVKLARSIDWRFLEEKFGAVYQDGSGRPPLPTRLMAGLAILKHTYNVSDEVLCELWLENPYYQYLCGEEFFQHELPFERSSISIWRKRMGEERLQALLQESLAVATRTGATVVCSPESARCLRAAGVPETQLLVVTGGETVHCGPTATVRVLPSLHSCLFAHSEVDTALPCLGDLDLSAQARAAKVADLFSLLASAPAPAGPALVAMNEQCSRHDGGQLAYLLATTGGSMLVSGSAGYWRGIFDGLRPDVALLSLGGRPNVDGEPFQGSSAQYVLEQAQVLRPGRIAFCHHDPLFPGLHGTDVDAAAAALRAGGAPSEYFALEYATPVRLFG